MTRKKKANPKKRSIVAKDLFTPKYKLRVVELKTRYSRKKTKKDEGEAE